MKFHPFKRLGHLLTIQPQSSPSHADAQSNRPLGWQDLCGLFLFAILVRSLGLLWGANHPDENISLSVKALAGNLIPDYHYYPPFLNYLNAVAYAVMFVLGRLIGAWWSLGDFRNQYFQDPSPFYFVGRLVTASLGATIAPLAALIAQQLRLPRQFCWWMGILGAIIPVQVWLSHISKSDVPLSATFLLVVWLFLRKVALPTARANDLGFGVALALAFSFKQSALFFVLPIFMGFLLLPKLAGLSWRATLQSAATVVVTAVLLIVPMNIGIFLDLQNFLEYQKVQAAMSVRQSTPWDTLTTWLGIHGGSWYRGATLPATALWLLFPLLLRNRLTLWVWGCTLASMLIILRIVGVRQPEGLWLPYSVLMVVLAGIGAATLALSQQKTRKLVGILCCLGLFLGLGWGSLEVLRQALMPPGGQDVAAALQQIPNAADAKILSSYDFDRWVNLDPAARQATRQRDQQLAQKYNVQLPPQAAEQLQTPSAPGADYYIRRIPFAIGGLEALDEKDIQVVKPFAWPLQKQEWQLDYWTKQGFSLFVVANEDVYLKTDTEPYRQLHTQIRQRCQLLHEFPNRRPIFFETDVRIYRCQA